MEICLISHFLFNVFLCDKYNIIPYKQSNLIGKMSNVAIFNDFYQVPNLSFDIEKLRTDLEKILKKSKYQTLE